MKQITQEKFNDYPNWVNSLAIDSDGKLHGYSVVKQWLSIDDEYHHAPLGSYSECLDDGYDTTDWQNSAIDREVTK